MMTKIQLNRKEIQKLSELFDKMNECDSYGTVTLTQEGDNGIGTTLKATFYVTHKDVEGEFTIDITTEEDW
jgi:hypothetical protein